MTICFQKYCCHCGIPESGEGHSYTRWPRTGIWATVMNNLDNITTVARKLKLRFTAFWRILPNSICTKVLPVTETKVALLMSKGRWNPLCDKPVCAVMGVSVIIGNEKQRGLLNNTPPPIVTDTDRNMPHDGVVTLLFLLFLYGLLAPLSDVNSSPLFSLSCELCWLLNSQGPPAASMSLKPSS